MRTNDVSHVDVNRGVRQPPAIMYKCQVDHKDDGFLFPVQFFHGEQTLSCKRITWIVRSRNARMLSTQLPIDKLMYDCGQSEISPDMKLCVQLMSCMNHFQFMHLVFEELYVE